MAPGLGTSKAGESEEAAAAPLGGGGGGGSQGEAAQQHTPRQGPEYVEEEDKDFQGQRFHKCKPVLERDNPQFTGEDERWGAAPLRCRAVNHVALGANDVDALQRFYTKVLGFRRLPRPDLGFPGHWLQGPGGVMLHIIQSDPTVPRRFADWKEEYAAPPEAWFIRRGSHIALEVEDFEEAEARLRAHGVEYSRFVLPDVDLRQLFFWDPEGNGVEVGRYDDTRRFLREQGEEQQG